MAGYELLHRGLATYGEQATAQVLLAAFGDIGLRRLVGSRPAWINVSRRFLLDVDPLPLPPGEVVLELLEDQTLDDELLGRLQELHVAGFTIALDDFTYTSNADDLLALASIVKVDVLDGGVPHAPRQAELLRPFGVTLLAEKVEDREMFEALPRPRLRVVPGLLLLQARARRRAARSRPRCRRRWATSRCCRARTPPSRRSRPIVTRDPGLTLRLLRLLNSASYSLRRRITSVHDAVTMLGARTVRQWAMMLVLGGVATDCDELVPTALSRAHTLSRWPRGAGATPTLAFSIGLLSVADALLGVTMAVALDGLPLADAVVDALLRREGDDGAALTAVLDYEWGTAPVGDPASRTRWASATPRR